MNKRVALITGVAGGIGCATAELFSAEGWYVIGIDQKPNQESEGIDHYIQADASDPEQILAAVERVTQRIGQLDALINNAAIQICKPAIEMELVEWDRTMAVNVRAAFLFSKAAYPLLKESQGSIVNVSSVHAIATSANVAAYATSKGAIIAFTRALGIELAPTKIRVNAILPGAVDTPMLHSGLARGHLSGTNLDELMQQVGQKTVMGKVGTPTEIAQAIFFLADSSRSSFMTGQTLVVDGGATAKLSTE
ncbi:MAG: NAD(P)-dependent oxidoreductase [Cyanobacteria bacterium QH_2_48_84]|nr:MAG: NAD(P)-dependent oxidoreductase [Cyanobacteria bacterium QH_2_48_84]